LLRPERLRLLLLSKQNRICGEKLILSAITRRKAEELNLKSSRNGDVILLICLLSLFGHVLAWFTLVNIFSSIVSISIRFVMGVGFSNGCALFALKKPPPLVPNSLIISCDATGP